MSTLRNKVRLQQSCDEYVRLRQRIEDWHQGRVESDGDQYRSQLENLGTFFGQLFDALGVQLANLDPGQASSAVYQACHTIDQKLVWMREVWRYYASKFDQRDEDDRLGEVIKAADEVVWSCYAGFYQNLSPTERKAPPLPYLEPLYTPMAIPRDQPHILRRRFISGKFFQEFLKELPIPVIGLPQGCLEEPWWLIFIGHEVGHNIQHDLLPDYGLVGDFATWLEAQAGTATTSARRAARWNKWGQEVFADAFSVYTLGVWAAWAMTELVLGDDCAMLTELDNYPAPAVRLAFLSRLASALGQDGQAALRGFVPETLTTGPPLEDDNDHDLRQEAKAHLELLPAIVQAIEDYPFDGLGSFERLTGWDLADFRPAGIVYDWTVRLQDESWTLPGKKRLDYPRLIASAGLAAWVQIAGLPDAGQRADATHRLALRLLEAITDSGPQDTRAPSPLLTVKGRADVGEAFAKRFLDTSLEDLGL
ncbi:MAG: hypothetical protein PVJ26_19640 [Anaerolineae bacterium]|jgi:hypothetical protein